MARFENMQIFELQLFNRRYKYRNEYIQAIESNRDMNKGFFNFCYFSTVFLYIFLYIYEYLI